MSQPQAQADVSTSEANAVPNQEPGMNADEPPPPPIPAADPKLQQDIIPAPSDEPASPSEVVQNDGIFHVSPVTALRLLSARVEMLVAITGDIPPTPPPKSPTFPNMRGMQAEKENIVRSHSERNLARLLSGGTKSPRSGKASPAPRSEASTPLERTTGAPKAAVAAVAAVAAPTQPIDGVHLRTCTSASHLTAADSSDTSAPSLSTAAAAAAAATAAAAEPYIVVGENMQPLNLQHSAITRKFYSKLPPPISVTDYLLRIHRFCPMSTAVYLATSLYIHRLAVTERAIAVTHRNVHRLLLAGLRVAMKALEDLSYPHSKIAKVGGVSEAELARLEISFCFLAGFELVVGEEALTKQWKMLRAENDEWDLPLGGGIGALSLDRQSAGKN